MTRGSSLVVDLKFLVNNSRYSDLKIKCSDVDNEGELLYASRIHLAARSEVFDRLLFNGMHEIFGNSITFPEISTAGMKLVLEFIYTGGLDKGSITASTAIDGYHAAKYFLLPDLEALIITFVEECLKNDSSGDFLSNAITKMGTMEDNQLYTLLSNHLVAKPLDSFPFNKMNLEMLKKILTTTLNTDQYFATNEYDILRYIILWAANQISEETLSAFSKVLPTFDSSIDFLKSLPKMQQIDYQNESRTQQNATKVAKIILPLIYLIDFRMIPLKALGVIIQPLNVLPVNFLLKVYQYHLLDESNPKFQRGEPHETLNFIWDTTACGAGLSITESNKVVTAKNLSISAHKSIRTINFFSGDYLYEWNVLIEEKCFWGSVGVCGLENLDFETLLDFQKNCWMIGESGRTTFNNGKISSETYKEFAKGDEITFYLNMKARVCHFSINNVLALQSFSELPAEVYMAASLTQFGRFRLKNFTRRPL
ncbi:hypothetical protein G9A89_010225 [Geosiphon pyriformis]|nr:hypothetical protein G9A89_010225 [Geosiphon pyriformis]